MRRTLWTAALIALLVPGAMTQEPRFSPSVTARERPHAVSTESGIVTTTPKSLPFCPPNTCLYYAGDFNSAASNANGLLNTNYDNGQTQGQVFVGVKPPKAAIVTGVTFNQFFTAGFSGTNPTPFQTQVGIVQGSGGTVVCTTSGHAVLTQYGESDFGLIQYSYTVKKLRHACKVQAGKKGATYISLLPVSSNGYGYVADVEDMKPKHHRGWKNDLDDSYFQGSEYSYQPTWGSSGACAGNGCDLFSIALTGKQSPDRITNAQPLSAPR
jgi:hypothetical protein